MRRLTLLLPLLAISLFAQSWSDPYIRVEMVDGREVSFPVVTTDDVPVIVEFRDPPLALVNARSAKAAMSNYQATFARFGNDVTAIVNTRVSGKAALSSPEVPEVRRQYFEAFNGVALTVPRNSLPALRALPYVKKVHLDTPVRALSIAVPANVSIVGADRVWTELGTRGKGIVVAIIDTGIDYRHPALGGCLGPSCRVLGGHDFVNDDDDPMDDHFLLGHGTHVAGIVGGNSDELIGVAPEVSFLAYKVLNEGGSGSQSNVIAGIERAIDPNGDGDLRDHADVVNLSLAGPGTADDAASTAVDNATAAGTLFAVAAGNDGDFCGTPPCGHNIGSPGTARQAITVGASDNGDHIAAFSSRGPSPKLITIKPDVVAPGVGIRSSTLNGEYRDASGTSMATPHVAGAVALIRALHPDWTPARIKTQLMNTAASIGEEIMVQGAGRIDAFRAASGGLTIDPPSISLGLDPIDAATWSQSATLHLTNRGTARVSYDVAPEAIAGVAISASPSSVSLETGESIDVMVSFTLTNADVTPAKGSFSVGGYVAFNGTGATSDNTRIPWGAVKAARALVTHDKEFASAMWIDEAAGVVLPARPISDTGDSEILLPPGKYDLFMESFHLVENTTKYMDLRLFFLEGLNLRGDTLIPMPAENARHTITFAGTDENGQPLTGGDYASVGRLILPGSSKVKSLLLPPMATRTWHVTDLPVGVTLLTHEIDYDSASGRMYVVPQRPLSGVTADVTLVAGGSSLKRADVGIFSPPAPFGDRGVTISVTPFSPSFHPSTALSLKRSVTTPSLVFNNALFLGPDTLPGFTFGVTYESITDKVSSFITPPIRIVNDRVVSLYWTAPLRPWTYSGTNFLFGSGLMYPLQTFAQGSQPNHYVIYTDFAGELNELRFPERRATVTTVFNGDGSVQAMGASYPLALDLSAPGSYRIEAVNAVTPFYPSISRVATITMNLDSSRADYFPPVFTAMMLFDGAGRIATRLERTGGGSLQFAAADYSYAGVAGAVTKTYLPLRAEATKVWYRATGTNVWLPLTVTQVMEDAGSDSVAGAGILFRADLAPLTNIGGAHQLYDLRFDIEDAAGNTTSYSLGPAFSVGPELLPRRRAAGR